MNKPKLNSDEYKKWCEAQIAEYMNAGLTDEITDEQAEAIEYLIGIEK